jgi:hypothetical protein
MADPSVRDERFIVLSQESALLYVLRRSKCVGRLTSGRVAVHESAIAAFDNTGKPIEYLSADNLTSWCLLGAPKQLANRWCHILPDDLPIIMRSPFGKEFKYSLASAFNAARSEMIPAR